MATDAQFTDLYRQSSIGLALVDAIDDLVTVAQRLEPQLAIKILRRFDRAMSEVLQRKVRDRLRFQGSLDTYRFCDEVWTFLVRNVTLKLVDGEGVVQADRVKIIACALADDGASPSQSERKKRRR